MTSVWSSAGHERLYVLPLGRHIVASCVLKLFLHPWAYGGHSHQFMTTKLQNCCSHMKSEKLSISAELPLTQLSLSILIISAAGAVRCTGL